MSLSVHAAMTLSAQPRLEPLGSREQGKPIFSFVVHRADGGWTCASAHDTDPVPNMETNVIGEDGAFRAANYRTGSVLMSVAAALSATSRRLASSRRSTLVSAQRAR